jgi:hypothetical protein
VPGESVEVVVVDPHNIYRRGLVVSLREDSDLCVVYEGATAPTVRLGDVALCRADLLPGLPPDMPAVVIAGGPCQSPLPAAPNVFAVLDRESLDTRHLVAAVRAAAVGLRILALPPTHELVSRDVEVLRLLADGAETREIAHSSAEIPGRQDSRSRRRRSDATAPDLIGRSLSAA